LKKIEPVAPEPAGDAGLFLATGAQHQLGETFIGGMISDGYGALPIWNNHISWESISAISVINLRKMLRDLAIL